MKNSPEKLKPGDKVTISGVNSDIGAEFTVQEICKPQDFNSFEELVESNNMHITKMMRRISSIDVNHKTIP